MKSQTKVKMLLSLAVIIMIALFALTGFQLVKIHQSKKEIAKQEQQITQLQQQIDAYEKTPGSEHDSITGEN